MRMTPAEFLALFPKHPFAKTLRAKATGAPASTAAGMPNVEARRSTVKLPPGAKATPSILEADFANQVRALKLPDPDREYAFCPGRRWRMDFAWPAFRLAVELEGGVWRRGRHTRPSGFVADTEKYNAASSMGWTVLRYTGKAVRDGSAISQVESMIRARANEDNQPTHPVPRPSSRLVQR